ncbi:hypothetical protein KPH14_000932 [Odynerus spinipes]|uniref:Uncharacterized protein n=1 Tax=Odynerus spinipes TaxID=1348599 RepID=A0AAD9RF99_9HYME|nr:hypothetical protein KPH14_000932 [Odynerus spinipes]
MPLVSNKRICQHCSKKIVQDAMRCMNCSSFFHPRCKGRKCCDNPSLKRLLQPEADDVLDDNETMSDDPQARFRSAGALPELMVTPSPSSPTMTNVVPSTISELFFMLNVRFDELSAQLRVLPEMQRQINDNTARLTALEQENRTLRTDLDSIRNSHKNGQLELRRTILQAHQTEIVISGAPCSDESAQQGVAQAVLKAINCNIADDPGLGHSSWRRTYQTLLNPSQMEYLFD